MRNLLQIWRAVSAVPQIHKDIKRMAAILDDIARDWPTLRDAIKSKLKDDADKINDLTQKLKGLDADDPRADQIEGEMQDLLKSLKGTVDTVPAPTPTQDTPAAPEPASEAPRDPQGDSKASQSPSEAPSVPGPSL